MNQTLEKVNTEQQFQEVNNLLSDLLNVWHFLKRIKTLRNRSSGQDNTNPVPPRLVPFVLLKSGILNDNCFYDFAQSAEVLRKYAPAEYSDLCVFPRKLEVLKKYYVLPLLLIDDKEQASEELMERMIEEAEHYLRRVAQFTDKDTSVRIDERLLHSRNENIEEELLPEIYELVKHFLPGRVSSYDHFRSSIENEDFRNTLHIRLEHLSEQDAELLLELTAYDPYLPSEQMAVEVIQRNLSTLSDEH